MNELSDLLLALIDLRVNTQLNNSNFLRKYTGYVASIDGENVKVMMDFVDKDKDEDITKAYTFINKTGSTNIQKGDNVEIICNKDFNNGYINKNLSVKQMNVVTEGAGTSLIIYGNGLQTEIPLDQIMDGCTSIVGKSFELNSGETISFSFGDNNTVGSGIVEFRGTDFVQDKSPILTHVKHNITINVSKLTSS